MRARQIGDSCRVSFLVSEARGTKPAQQPVLAELVRVSYPPGLEPPPDPDAFRRRGEVVARVEGDPLTAGERLELVDEQLTSLPAHGVDNTIRYGVRVLDRRSRPSPLVVAPDLRPLASLPAPERLTAEPTADGVRLSWTPPAGVEAAQYNVYRREGDAPVPLAPRNPAPVSATEFLDTEVVVGRTYKYLVRISLADGQPYREGESSRSVEVVAEDRFAPAAPRGIVAVQEGPAVRLFWDPSSERDLAGYRVYRRLDEQDWQRVGPDPVERPLYLDGDVQPGQILAYRVTAIDRASPPNESRVSEVVRIEVSAEPGARGTGP